MATPPCRRRRRIGISETPPQSLEHDCCQGHLRASDSCAITFILSTSGTMLSVVFRSHRVSLIAPFAGLTHEHVHPFHFSHHVICRQLRCPSQPPQKDEPDRLSALRKRFPTLAHPEPDGSFLLLLTEPAIASI
uniref:Uncharacterized protein n=1 Tax=Oryza punctata TaxID=4537 RepID=A0A0E0LLE3_ORYPU